MSNGATGPVATALDAGCDAIVAIDHERSKLKGIPFVCLDDIIEK
jgi:hypothetical protein